MEDLDGGWYKLGCSVAEFSELADIPQTTISLTAAVSIRQSIGNESAHCNCRANIVLPEDVPVKERIAFVAQTVTLLY